MPYPISLDALIESGGYEPSVSDDDERKRYLLDPDRRRSEFLSVLDEDERRLWLVVQLPRNRVSKQALAQHLGIARSTLYERLRRIDRKLARSAVPIRWCAEPECLVPLPEDSTRRRRYCEFHVSNAQTVRRHRQRKATPEH